MPVIKGHIAFAKLQNPVPKWKPEQGDEYTVDLVISKKQARSWKKSFPKQSVREVATEDFKDVFKFDPPYPEQEDQFVIKFRQNAQLRDKKTGETKPIAESMRIQVFEVVGKGSGKKPLMANITDTKLVANGSYGVVQYVESPNDFGTFAKARAIRVDELIEYKPRPSYDELGELSGTPDFEDESEEDDDDIKGDEDDDVEEDDDDLY